MLAMQMVVKGTMSALKAWESFGAPEWKLWQSFEMTESTLVGAATIFEEWWWPWLVMFGLAQLGLLAYWWATARYIPNDQVGVVEKLWSTAGSVPEGSIIALGGEAGYQADVLRGGLHFGYWRWQYRIHKTSLVTVPQGKIGYVYARDGEPLSPSQTLGRVAECNNYQDARGFLRGVVRETDEEFLGEGCGQRGRQRSILREGVYAINLALFVVITEEQVFALRQHRKDREVIAANDWQQELSHSGGFDPVIVGAPISTLDPVNRESFVEVDSIAIVTVHD